MSGQGGRGESVYVRRDGDDRVYQMRGGLAAMSGLGETEWREKTIALVEPAQVQRVEVERGRERYTLTRADDGWMLNGAAADTARVEKMLRRYINLQPEGKAFATPAEADSADFARPDRRITLLGAAGDTLAALLYDSTDTGYWVRHAAGGTVYHMYGYRVEVSVPADSNLMPR
jgi:hypothetical protein